MVRSGRLLCAVTDLGLFRFTVYTVPGGCPTYTLFSELYTGALFCLRFFYDVLGRLDGFSSLFRNLLFRPLLLF